MSELPSHRFEWKHTREDQLEALIFQINRMQRGKLYASQRRRSMLILFLVCLCPLAIILLINLDQQTLASWIGMSVFVIMMLAFTFRKQNPRELDKQARTQAQRYLDSLDEINLGTHQLEIKGDLLSWYWVEGRSRIEYPLESVKAIESHEGRLYLIRPANYIDSIPFHAFGDQATREAIIGLLRSHMEPA